MLYDIDVSKADVDFRKIKRKGWEWEALLTIGRRLRQGLECRGHYYIGGVCSLLGDYIPAQRHKAVLEVTRLPKRPKGRPAYSKELKQDISTIAKNLMAQKDKNSALTFEAIAKGIGRDSQEKNVQALFWGRSCQAYSLPKLAEFFELDIEVLLEGVGEQMRALVVGLKKIA